VHGSGCVLHAVLVARGIRRALDEGNWLGGFFRRQRADAAREHGAAAVRTAGCRRLGSRDAMVFDRDDAGADEFRVDAVGQSEIQTGAGRRSRERITGSARELHALAHHAGLQRVDAWGPHRLCRLGCLDGIGHTNADEGVRPGASDSRICGVPIRMISRRQFVKNGVAAFTVGFAAPAFLSDLARAQGATSRNLVVLDLGGGNDGLSTLVPYTDSFYYSRRPTIAIPAGTVLQIGSDSSGKTLGLHPRLTGLRSIFNQGRLAVIQRVGYQNSSRSHFSGTDIWSTGNPPNTQGSGWVGRYLSTIGPLDPRAAWSTTGDTPHALLASGVPVAAISNIATYAFNSPNNGNAAEVSLERSTAASIASHLPINQPHISF